MTLALTVPLQKNLTKISKAPVTAETAAHCVRDFIHERQTEIAALLPVLTKNIETLELQRQRCSDIIAILEEAGGLTVRARNYVTTPQDAEKYRDKTKDIETLFTATIKKLDTYVDGATDNGVNLPLGGALTSSFGGKDDLTLTTQGILLNSENLGIRPAHFIDFMHVQNSRIDVMNAIDMAVTLRNIIAADIATLSISRDFSTETVRNATTAETALSATPLIEEAAALKQLSNNKSICDTPLAEEAQQNLLDSFTQSPNMEEI